MRKLLSALVIVLASVVSQTHAENWPQFRGPTGQGISTETNLPLEWSQTKNIAWKTEIPGAGWSSPVVWENRVFITAATDEGTACHVMCLDRDSGKVLWDVQVFKQTPSRKETRNSYATPTPVTDGKRVYCFFGEGGGVALGFDGRVAWTYTKDSYYSQHGLGASPILYKDLLFMPWDPSIRGGPEPRIGWQIPWDKSYVLALDKNTGQVRYKAMRGMSRIGHMTPHMVEVDGRMQLVSSAGDIIEGFDPENGKRIWWVYTGGEGVVPSPVIGDGMVFSSSGFPTPVGRREIHAAVRAFRLGGHGDVTQSNFVWENRKFVPMIPSLLLMDHLLYSMKEDGTLQCMQDSHGKVVYRQHLDATYSASPLYSNGRIYFLSDNGDTTVIQAGDEFKQIAVNPLGESCQASMAASDGRIFIRTSKHLWCIK
ncbi:MAG TPA: PQQ-binding-like beta-propeller repeat protein [Tepidisphaeraceae bacterium]|nr:PQQ-binding-like beta-propeller repeat protein [Tepidisphaeraceae bacterium]